MFRQFSLNITPYSRGEDMKKAKKIYRCGWCGYPVSENGDFLPEIKDNDDASKYLRENKEATEILVNSSCCPNGNY